MPLLGLAGGMHDDFDLTGEVAIVTGGGSGIGAAVARGLAEAGASVVPAARTAADVEDVAADIREEGGEDRGVSADQRASASVRWTTSWPTASASVSKATRSAGSSAAATSRETMNSGVERPTVPNRGW